MNCGEYEIDLVYLWCDASDAKWARLRNETALKYALELEDDNNGACRVQSHDELRYAIRSAEMYAPWINKIFIVVDDVATLPSWLDVENPRLRIVRHSEIIPREFLPCFSSTILEHYIACIKDLSEHFLYSNDDFFFGAPVKPEFFFATDGKPIFRVGNYLPEHAFISSHYQQIVRNAYELVVKSYPELSPNEKRNICRFSHHNIDSYCKSDCLAIFEQYKDSIVPTFSFPFRSDNQYQRSLYMYEALVSGRGHLHISHKNTELMLEVFDKAGANSYKPTIDYLWTNTPFLFVLNDNERQTEGDYRTLNAFLDLKYPNPSSFEIV